MTSNDVPVEGVRVDVVEGERSRAEQLVGVLDLWVCPQALELQVPKMDLFEPPHATESDVPLPCCKELAVQ